MTNRFLKVLNLIILLIATAWMISYINWESSIVFLTALITFIALIFKNEDPSARNADINLFNKFNNDLPYYNISFIDSTSLNSTFDNEYLDPFFHFNIIWNDAHHIFLSKILEKKKQKLLKSNSKFTSLVYTNTFPVITNANRRLSSIPEEWEINDKKEYDMVSEEISHAQEEVVKSYNDFVKTAKRSLKV